MKKYKVITDNLDWFGINKGHVYVENDFGHWFCDDIKCNSYNQSILTSGCLNPDWFEEVKDLEFTKDDMKLFAKYAYNRASILGITSSHMTQYLNEWLANFRD